jgi:hypothetical protein
MPDALVLPDSMAGRADVLPPAFVCAWTDGGLDPAWVHVVGELDIATTVLRGPPDVDRIFTLSGNVDVEIYDLDPVEPPAHMLLRLAGEELAA